MQSQRTPSSVSPTENDDTLHTEDWTYDTLKWLDTVQPVTKIVARPAWIIVDENWW